MKRLVALVAASTVLAGCGGTDQPASAGAGRSVTGQVTVFAAASLTETFTRIGEDFEAAHPGTTVRVNFGGSSALAQQIGQGAPADVFASASPATMKQVADTGAVTFARNRLQIAVARDNPMRIGSLADLTRPDVKLALCAEQVPCGDAAKKAFEAARLTPRAVTLEQDVKATLTKVKLGEVDAALVYRTDVAAAAEDVTGVDFPEAAQAVNDYPIVALPEAANAAGGKAFVDFVLSAAGRGVLTQAGFEAP